jgi:hypothetical protein
MTATNSRTASPFKRKDLFSPTMTPTINTPSVTATETQTLEPSPAMSATRTVEKKLKTPERRTASPSRSIGAQEVHNRPYRPSFLVKWRDLKDPEIVPNDGSYPNNDEPIPDLRAPGAPTKF